MLYLRYGLFNRPDLWKNEFRKYDDKVLIRDKPYILKLDSNQNKLVLQGNAQETFINHISGKHRDKVYRQLYDSGRETTTAEKVWDVFKHLIPLRLLWSVVSIKILVRRSPVACLMQFLDSCIGSSHCI